MSGLRLENIVCEVPSLGDAPRGFWWYEIDADTGSLPAALAPPVPGGAAVVVATRLRALEAHTSLLSHLAGTAATHLQFEFRDLDDARAVVVEAGTAGIAPLPSIHLQNPPASFADLMRSVEMLQATGARILKLAFPATTPVEIGWGLRLLATWHRTDVGLCATPMGTREGRVAAAVCGSRLVHAPLVGTDERPSAAWFHDAVRAEEGA